MSADSRGRHMRTVCKIVGSTEGMELLYEHTLQNHYDDDEESSSICLESQDTVFLKKTVERQARQMEHQAEQMCQMMEMMRQMQSQLSAHPTINNMVQAIDNSVNKTINVQLNIFGQEDVSYLDKAAIRSVLDRALEATPDPAEAAKRALTKIGYRVYSDPGHPENMTCYMSNKKRSEVMVFLGESHGWQLRRAEDITPEMYKRSMDILFQQQPFYDSEKYGDTMLQAKEGERSGRFMKELRPRYEAVLTESTLRRKSDEICVARGTTS